MKGLFRTKPIIDNSITEDQQHSLKKCLTAFDLTLMGVGAIIGAGIFVLTGLAAATQAGPAIVLSYAIAGVACALSALSYAELASSIGGCGSAYGYAYTGLGEFIAFIIGWDLILEYGISTSTVAVGWSGYVNNALSVMGIHLPDVLIKNPFQGGWVDLPAVAIVLIIATVLSIGVTQSKRFNAVMVFIKLFAIGFFIAIASAHINPANWHTFMPFGFKGVIGGSALIFFAFIGFDAVSTAAEEAINPQRDLPIGIIASLVICTLIYVIFAGLLTAIAPYETLNVKSAVADALLHLGYNFSAAVVAVGAIAGFTTVALVMYYGLTRVFFAISRDGLLPPLFSRVNAKTQTPMPVIWLSSLLIGLSAGFVPINALAELVNIGTLVAFIIVSGGVIALRYTHPNLPRPFKTPFGSLIPLLGIILCSYLALSLPLVTWIRFAIWMLIGVVIYFGYSYQHSKLAIKTCNT